MSNAIKTTLLLAALTAIFLAVGEVLGGQSGLIFGFVLAVVLNVGSYWFSGDIALRMAGAHEVTPDEAPQLHQIVEQVAASAGLPKPRVALINSPAANAFATGRNADHAVVAVTTGIMQLLSRDELIGVLSHEIGHVRNHDILISSVAATIAGAIIMVARMAQFAMLFGGGYGGRDRRDNGIVVLLTLILAPIAATLVQLAISRSREYGADATGAAIEGTPEPLARALEKLETYNSRGPAMNVSPAAAHLFIVNPLKGANFATLFSTHPPIAERIRRLREMELRAI